MDAPEPFIDSHCHLDPENCMEGADAVIERARVGGVQAFVCIGVGSLEAAEFACNLAEQRKDVSATVGVHPHEALSQSPELEHGLLALAKRPSVVAIGEIGLDYHYDHSPRPQQQAVFRRYVAIARELDKPIVVHTRSAPQDTLDILREEQARDVGGIIHCFSEDLQFARAALDLGFYISFSGIVTFKRAEAIQAVARWVPQDRYLVETDSPYLAPVPKRGKKNEPSYLLHTARCLAELRGQSVATIARETTANACRVLRSQLV